MSFNSAQLTRKLNDVHNAIDRYYEYLADGVNHPHLSTEEFNQLFSVQIELVRYGVEVALEDYRAYARSICEEEIH